MKNPHVLGLRMGVIVCLVATMGGCISTNIGFQNLPERSYQREYQRIRPLEVHQVRHVKERLWGMHVLGYQLKRPAVRELIQDALAENPNYYVSDLQIQTEIHGTLVLIAMVMYLPRVTVEFDVVEVVPTVGKPSPKAR